MEQLTQTFQQEFVKRSPEILDELRTRWRAQDQRDFLTECRQTCLILAQAAASLRLTEAQDALRLVAHGFAVAVAKMHTVGEGTLLRVLAELKRILQANTGTATELNQLLREMVPGFVADSATAETGSTTKKPRTTVLVVDDEDLIRAIIKKYLNTLQIDVLTAENGEEALRIVDHNPVALIVTDYVMPVMDGLKLMDEVAKRGLTIPFIATSGVSDADRILDLYRKGIREFLSKPIKGQFIKAAVAKILDEQDLAKLSGTLFTQSFHVALAAAHLAERVKVSHPHWDLRFVEESTSRFFSTLQLACIPLGDPAAK